MKSTGVIRRIDELGRVVIPKEIRRHLGIRDGENLEIFTEEDKIILKKYSSVLEYSDLSSKLCDMVSSIMEYSMIITDRDKVVSFSNDGKEELKGCTLNAKMLDYIQNRENYESLAFETFEFGDKKLEGYCYIQPIISSIDCLGLVVLVKSKSFLKEEKQFARFVAEMIANKIDIS